MSSVEKVFDLLNHHGDVAFEDSVVRAHSGTEARSISLGRENAQDPLGKRILISGVDFEVVGSGKDTVPLWPR